jgi:hypothetical protein
VKKKIKKKLKEMIEAQDVVCQWPAPHTGT